MYSSSSSRKKRAKKSLNAFHMPTTREKLRLLRETNLVDRKSLLDREFVSEMVDLARGRIHWIKNRVMLFWNPDYREETDLVVSRLPGKNDGHPQQQQQRRRFTHTTILDERWWIWNIVLALSPALLIALFCEFIGKPSMLEFHKRQALAQIQIAMGEDYTEAKGLAIYNAKREIDREPTTWEKLHEFYTIVQSWLFEDDEDDMEKPPTSSENTGHDDSKMSKNYDFPQQLPPLQNLVRSVESSSTSSRERTATSMPTTVPGGGFEDPSREPTVAELMQRIQQLETMIVSSSNPTTTINMENKTHSAETPLKHATEKEINERLRRIQQSGSMNRFEDQFRYKWGATIAAIPSEVLDRVEELEQEKKRALAQQAQVDPPPSIWESLRGYANDAMAWWTGDDSQPKYDTEEPLSTTEHQQTAILSESRPPTPSEPTKETQTPAKDRPLVKTTSDRKTDSSTMSSVQAVDVSDANVAQPEAVESTREERPKVAADVSAEKHPRQYDEKLEEVQPEEGMNFPTTSKPWYLRFWRPE